MRVVALEGGFVMELNQSVDSSSISSIPVLPESRAPSTTNPTNQPHPATNPQPTNVDDGALSVGLLQRFKHRQLRL